ncbi:MAG: hypothetical protein J6W00_14770, partial [Lentisphaeria bacterium]|nr:hypothetical protein [Lentisphaeria bacterium]
ESVWQDHIVDNGRWLNHQCYKTRTEAEAASAKIRELLLSLHYSETLQTDMQDKQLPDWCKVDATGWHKRCGYFKVTYIDNVSKRVDIQQVEDKSKGYLSFHTVCDEVVQARLRPYNAVEMKSLVGRTVDSDYGSVCLVTKFYATSEGGEVFVDGIYYNANKLLDEFTINNKPCGVFEHLENGEWVE